MAKDQGPLSGFRDMLPAQALARNQVINTVTAVFELYGFSPIKTPAIEKFETLSGKYGDEANMLMYNFHDHGDRHVALRYDHSVPLARVMAQYGQSLPSPFKRYVVGDVWRGESPQAGRYREFTQIDADVVGSASYLADTEVIAMTADIFANLNLPVRIQLNDRRILDGLAQAAGINERADFVSFVAVIDKLAKIGEEAVLKEIEQKFNADAAEAVKRYLSVSGDDEAKLNQVLDHVDKTKASAGVDNLKQILGLLKSAGYSNIEFSPSIARGLNYYTSTIFETTITGLETLGSVCSGGRFDDLIKQLGGHEAPAVGTSVGLDRLMEGLKQLGVEEAKHTNTRAYITNLDPALDGERFKLAQTLRKAGIATELYYDEVKLGKQLAAIDKLGVNQAIIYGPEEQSKGVVVIRDLKNSSQKELPLEDLHNEFS